MFGAGIDGGKFSAVLPWRRTAPMFLSMRIVSVALLPLLVASARAEEPAASKEDGKEEQSLVSKVTDPTASLMQLKVEYKWTPDYWGVDGHAHTFTFRPTIPFKVWERPNILRITLPYDVETQDDTHGLAAVQVSDPVVFAHSWGRWGLAPEFNFAPNDGKDQRFQLGPALGFTARHGKWNLGLFSQNLFGPDSAQSQLQPIVAYQFSKAFSLSLGDLQVILDWEDGEVTQVPLSLQPNLLFKVSGQPFHVYVNPQYNLVDHSGSFRWQVTFALVPLVE